MPHFLFKAQIMSTVRYRRRCRTSEARGRRTDHAAEIGLGVSLALHVLILIASIGSGASIG